MKIDASNLLKFSSEEECPSFFDHTPHPSGYIEHHAWMRKMQKTHRQIRCTRCGFYSIWVEKPKRDDG